MVEDTRVAQKEAVVDLSPEESLAIIGFGCLHQVSVPRRFRIAAS